MKELLFARYGLGHLQWTTRFIFTLFLGFCLVSYGVMIWMGLERSGYSHAAIADYYAGNEAQDEAGEIEIEAVVYAKPQERLVELTHFHLFRMPVLLFIQGHLFLLTRLPRKLKVGIVIAAFLGASCDLAAPWLITLCGRDWAWVKSVGRALLGPALLAFFFVPVWELWFAPKGTPKQPAS